MKYKRFVDLEFNYRVSFRDRFAEIMFENDFGIRVSAVEVRKRQFLYSVIVIDSNEELYDVSDTISDKMIDIDRVQLDILMRKIQRLEKYKIVGL